MAVESDEYKRGFVEGYFALLQEIGRAVEKLGSPEAESQFPGTAEQFEYGMAALEALVEVLHTQTIEVINGAKTDTQGGN